MTAPNPSSQGPGHKCFTMLHLMVAAVIGWRTSPWDPQIGSRHWSPMSRTSVPTEMTHRLTMIPERIGDLGPHEHRDPNQLWHPGILTSLPPGARIVQKNHPEIQAKETTLILNHHQHYHQKITPCLDHPEKTKHPRLNEICRSQIMSHFRRSVVPLWGLVFLVLKRCHCTTTKEPKHACALNRVQKSRVQFEFEAYSGF